MMGQYFVFSVFNFKDTLKVCVCFDFNTIKMSVYKYFYMTSTVVYYCKQSDSMF